MKPRAARHTARAEDEAAKASHLARPTFYERLRWIERILGTDLSSAESRTSLHVALLALNASRLDAAQSPRPPHTRPAGSRSRHREKPGIHHSTHGQVH